MKYIKITLFLLILNGFSLFGQTELSSVQIESKNFPMADINNIIKLLELSSSEWETEMEKFDFANRGLNEGCVYYTSFPNIDSHILTFKRCPGPELEINWSDISNSEITFLDVLVNELEPHYKNTDDNSVQRYAFKFNDFIYDFRIIREDKIELVRIKKIVKQKNK